jgi:flagellar biosynthesis protein FliP
MTYLGVLLHSRVLKQSIAVVLAGIGLLVLCHVMPASAQAPAFELSIGQNGGPQYSGGIQLILFMTLLALIPSLLMLCTAFTRIVIVMTMMRQAVGVASLPPNQVLIALSMMLTFFVMAPTLENIYNKAWLPYSNQQINETVAFERATAPLKTFMLKQTQASDITWMSQLAGRPKPARVSDVPLYVVVPAFVMSEVKTALQFGFVILLPFLVIDMVVSSILVSMGMMFLPPMSISLPFKLILFVLVDGWRLITEALVLSFN